MEELFTIFVHFPGLWMSLICQQSSLALTQQVSFPSNGEHQNGVTSGSSLEIKVNSENLGGF